MRIRILLCCLLAISCCLEGADARAEPALSFSADEVARILTLGPWPPQIAPDPSNRASGNQLAIELGRQLFFDPRMSPIGYIACVTCHQPDRAFADTKARGHGLADLERNTIALANLRLQSWYGWGGSSDSLWMASLRPILDPREFNGSAGSVVRLFRRDEELADCYRRAFNASPFADDERTLVNVAKALAAYEETLVTGRTPFDDYRDALMRGAPSAVRYPLAAQRGLRVFVGSGNCIACHTGPNFSDGAFHEVGAPPPLVPGIIDQARADGVRNVVASRFNLLGPHNDDPTKATAAATRDLAKSTTDPPLQSFRTPSLRNVAVTAPYMHNGHVETLQAAVRLHAQDSRQVRTKRGSTGESLTEAAVNDLTAFLTTLTDVNGERRPRPVARAPCP